MRLAFSLLLVSWITFSSFAQGPQEICNNGVDDDFDGFIDCYDGSCANSPLCDGIFLGNDADCEAPPPVFPQFTMSLDFASPNETTNHLSRMAVGDLDGDGVPEIVTMNRYTKNILILNGNNGTVKVQKTVTWEPYWEIAIANIRNGNGACGEIFFIGYSDPPGPNNGGTYMFAYDCNLNLLWTSANRFPDDPINFGLADFDGDGLEEIYAKDEILDARTGIRIIKSTGATYNRINGGPVAINMLGDAKLELVIGLAIYSVDLGNRTADNGSLTLVKSRSEYFVRHEYNATSVADYNQDGFLDVLASGSTTANGDNTTVFYWDVENDQLKTYSDFLPAQSGYAKGWKNGTGRLNIADLDGDGQMNASYVSGRYLYALNEHWKPMWRVNINEETSGHTGCTLFDFNGDGKSEIVYRDERFLYIIQGTDGSIYSQQACISRTNREYPIVADVDADGSTELCVACGYKDANAAANFNQLDSSRYSHIRVFKSAAEPWVPARRVWNQHGYFVVNVNDDLTIPTALQQHHLVFSTGNCTQGPNRPLNKFLNQSPFLNSEGCPTYASADIAFHVDPTVTAPTCPDLNFTASFQITNLGDIQVTGNIPVTFYTTNPKRAGAVKLNTIQIPVAQLKKGDVVTISNAIVQGIGSDSVYVVLNDAGTTPVPITLPNTDFLECNYDNIRGLRVTPIPADITGIAVNENETCSATLTGVARAFVPISGGGENTADYNFYWSNGAVAKPIASADYAGAIYSGIPAGTYSVYARHKTANCGSDTTQVVIGTTTTNFPAITVNTIQDQTSCAPANGSLEVVIAGGGGGYSIDWFDQALNALGISGPTANNLQAGSYVAVISRGPCNTSIPGTVAAPDVPDAQANTVSDVLDCSNPNSGSINADAVVNGVVQNPANYTFTWYEYDNVAGVRGSILDPVHGTGPTRTGLPVGHYQVVVTENVSECPSTITPIVDIGTGTVFPDPPQITIVSQQTSCDPLNPNGVMTASVSIGGVAQNPADFTFEWFRGQTTDPAFLVTNVSDVNGKTVHGVAGGGVPYTVRVTNQFNCSATNDRAITEVIVNPVVTLAQLTPNSICDASKASSPFNGSLQASVTFGGNPVTLPDNNYEFIWRDPANQLITVSDPKNPILSGVQDGNAYSVTVRRVDRHCNSNTDTEPVTRTTILPQLATSSTGSNNCDATLTPDGTATVTVTNAAIGHTFSYQWFAGNAATAGNELSATNNNANQSTAIRLGGPTGAPNPYTVRVTNNNTGCEQTATRSVNDVSANPVISFVNVTPNTICAPATSFNGSLLAQVNNQLGPITNYVFTWYNGGTANPANVNNSSTGVQLSGVDSGPYTVDAFNTVTGCRSSAITNNVPNGKVIPAISFTSVGSNNCDASLTPDGTLTANVTNGGTSFSYAWTAIAPAAPINNVNNNANQHTAIRLGGPTNAPNSYQVLVTNTATGCQNTGVGQVADASQKPTLTLAVTPNSICQLMTGGPAAFNGQIQVTAVNHPRLGVSAISYEWFNADAAGTVTGTNTTSTTATLSQLDNGKYGIRATVMSLGCTSDIRVEEVLDDVTPVAISTNTDPSTNCAPLVGPNGRAEVLAPVGATIRYQWYNGSGVVSGNEIAGATNALLGTNIQGSASANFTVLVTNLADGCQNNEPVNVPDGKVIPTIALSRVQPNTICDVTPTREPNGILQATITNGGTNFDVIWTGGVSPATEAGTNGVQFTKLIAGSYSATVRNIDTGCESTADTETVLDNFTFPSIAFTVTPQTSCDATDPNGALVATDNGVTAGRTFEWFTGAGVTSPLSVDAGDQSNRIDDLPGDDFSVRVTIDATGCQALQTRPVPESVTNPTISLTNSVQVTACDFGATPNGQATTLVSGLSSLPGLDYTVYYIRTVSVGGVNAGTYPTDPAVIKASAEAFSSTTTTTVPAVLNLAPGYLSAVVVDNNTKCESLANTVVIQDNTANYTFTIQGTAAAGLCNQANPGGAIDLTVLKNGAACGSCSYQWYDGTPQNTEPINFFDEVPNMGTASIISTSIDLGPPGGTPAGGVEAGSYTLILTDNSNGCGDLFVGTVPNINPPNVTITPTQPTKCINAINATNDGIINVSIVPNALNNDGYTINLYSGTSAVPANLVATTNLQLTNPVTLNQTGLNFGDYFVEIIDEEPANKPCPFGYQVNLRNRARAPRITINSIAANSSCTPVAGADGKVTLTATKETTDTTTPNYSITSISPVPLGYTAPTPIGASGTQVGPITGFSPQSAVGSYTIRVVDAISFCFSDAVVNIPDQQVMPSNINVSATPETMCAPGSNGAATAALANGENVSFFNFDWFKNDNGTGSVTGGPVAGGVPQGHILNQGRVVAPADWAIGSNGFGSGSRTYYVRGVRNSTAANGVGCPTDLKQVVIQDQHLTPNILLSATANSFCNALNPGDLGDGSISVTVDANPGLAGTQTTAGGFNYTWTNANAALTSPRLAQPNTLLVPQLNTGSFAFTVTNVDNGCVTSNSIAVPTAPFFVEITGTSIAHQLICNPNGQANVTEIKVDRSALSLANIVQTSALPLTNVYDFQWFPADPANPNVMLATPLQDGVGPTNINAQSLVTGNGVQQFPTMGAGSYYVRATRRSGAGVATGCQSLPVRIDIEDQHRNPAVALRPFSNTSCTPGIGEGELEVRVTDATNASFGPVFSYNYDWTVGAIADVNGNDGDGSSADGDGDRITGLFTGNYALTVTNPASGCSGVGNTTILPNQTPVFVQDVDPVDQINCDFLGDGSLTVTQITLNDRNGVTQTINAGNNINQFEFDWRRNGSANVQTTPGTLLHVGNFDAAGFGGPIGAGTYTVVARRIAGGPGLGCVSSPFTVNIEDKRRFPVASLLPLANTSCDPLSSEGSINVTVADGTLVPGPHTFTYTWDNINNPSSIVTAAPGLNDGDGTATDGDEDNPLNLRHGLYTLTVRNNQSQCVSTATTTIFQNATPIIIPQATSTPQILCSADGTIQVDLVNVTDRNGVTSAAPFSDFEFVWSRTTLANVVATTPGANGQVPGGTIIDRTIYNQIGLGQYFVVARRVSGNVGRGCLSAPYNVQILDERLFPELTFQKLSNSSCDVAAPNGIIEASAREINGNNTANYIFTWQLNGGAISPASVQSNTSNSSRLTDALDGTYTVTATNQTTSCPAIVPSVLELDQTRSTPNIIDVTTVDPLDCNPTGSATVTKITLGSTTNSILFPPNLPPNNEIVGADLNNFDYEWYQGSVTPANQLPVGGPFTTTPNISSLVAGTYYVVVLDPETDCRSTMKEVVISPANIVYPELRISQTARQVMCTIGSGSAALAATADGQTDANPNYSFTWFANQTNTPPTYASTSAITNLIAGTYSVTVLDNTTNCTASDFYIVEDNSIDLTPVVSTGSQPRTLCVGTDGEVTARVVNIDPTYPFGYNASTFTADLYIGANPNLSATPDFPAMAFLPGTVTSFHQTNLTEGPYTVRITDNNTGCVGTAVENLLDKRTPPEPLFVEIQPVTNCDPLRPNGVGQVTAGGTFIGYTFDWYEGPAVAGTPIFTGPEFGELKVEPQVYTIQATDVFTGCTAEIQATVANGTLAIPMPKIDVLSNVTSCVIDNGGLSAFVGPEKNTRDYIFNWYDGTAEKSSPDHVGVMYLDLAAGQYGVTATSRITGCKSPIAIEEIIIDQDPPDFTFTVEKAMCETNNGYASITMLTNVPIASIEWFTMDSDIAFLEGPNYTNASAGTYLVTATTFLGCETTREVTIEPDVRPFNGVSRNNDGMNDFFQIDCIDAFPNNVVKIYNRAGTLVYEGFGYNNIDIKFDGKSNKGLSPMGVNLPDGTYFYIVDKRDGSKPLAGYLEIVK